MILAQWLNSVISFGYCINIGQLLSAKSVFFNYYYLFVLVCECFDVVVVVLFVYLFILEEEV